MDRVPEPELMDDTAQARAYAAADFTASDQAMVERLLGLFAGQAGSAGSGPAGLAPAGPAGAGDPAAGLGARIVDLGCGPGNITFRLAAACPQASVLGIDGAPAMLAIAAERLAAGPASSATTRFLHLVLPDPRLEAPPLAGSFSAVVSNSLLHHLHDPAVFWSAAAALAAPGAVLYVRDLRRPPSAAAAQALVEERMAGAPAVLRRDFHQSLLAAFTAAEVAEQLDRASLRNLQVAELDDRYLEVWGRL